ncbi:MAG: KdsC family phosphatase [Bernardetiaceae bacterium]
MKTTKIANKFLSIRALLTDVDGVLTDGGIIYDNNQNEWKRFNAKDGLIVKPLQSMGFVVGAITGRESGAVARRLHELGLDTYFQGSQQKTAHYETIKARFGLRDEQIAYIGDDLNDLPVLMQCGLSACPADAVAEVRARVDWVLEVAGGQGAFRAFAERILAEQGRIPELLAMYQPLPPL